MSIAHEILKAAIERSKDASAQHLAKVQEVCGTANDNIKKSRWEHRLEFLKGAAEFVKGATTPTEKEDEPPGTT